MRLFAQQQPYVFHSAVATAPVYVAPNHQPALEISLVLEGSITFLEDGRERVVAAPAATLSACRQSLGVRVDAKRATRAVWCNYRGIRLSEARWAWLDQIPAVQPVSDRLMSLFTTGLSAPHVDGDPPGSRVFGEQVRDALGCATFSEYFRQAGAVPVTLPSPVALVKRYIDEHYASTCDIDRLAEMADINPRYLIHLFHKHVGYPPIRYLWRRRVEEGAHLLRATNHSIDEIAYCCGFQTTAHFSRRIKLEYKRSPGAIRQSRD